MAGSGGNGDTAGGGIGRGQQLDRFEPAVALVEQVDDELGDAEPVAQPVELVQQVARRTGDNAGGRGLGPVVGDPGLASAR